MNAHMQINSPVLREQAQQSLARRERLWPQKVVQISLHDGHVTAFREHVAKYWTDDERRDAVKARRAALIRKWGRQRRDDYSVGYVTDTTPTNIPVAFIIAQVSARTGISVNDILSQRRSAEYVHARHIAIYLAKVMTTRSLPEIGRRFGGRDHTTILHAARKIQYLVDHDKDFATEIEAHRRAILDVAHAGA